MKRINIPKLSMIKALLKKGKQEKAEQLNTYV